MRCRDPQDVCMVEVSHQLTEGKAARWSEYKKPARFIDY